MLVNNEVGTIQPLAEVAALVRERAPRAVLHTDAVQALPWLDVAAAAADVDLVAISGAQVRRPEGRRRARRARRRRARAADRGRRPGARPARRHRRTSPASSRWPPRSRVTARAPRRGRSPRIAALRDRLDAACSPRCPDVVRERRPAPRRSPATCTSAFPGVEAETLLVAARPGTACARRRARRARRARSSRRTCSPRWAWPATTRSSSVRFSLGYASTRRRRRRRARRRSPTSVAQLRAGGRVSVSERVLVAMSGGVDSSVAAALLREQGHDVTGVTLKLWGGESDSGCCSVADVEDARRVAAQLGIPHYVFNFADDFDAARRRAVRRRVRRRRDAEPVRRVQPHRSSSAALLERAEALGLRRRRHRPPRAGRRRRADGPPRSRRGADRGQGPVVRALHARPARARAHAAAGRRADQGRGARARGRALGLRTATKPESMDVCFITRGGRERVPRRAHRRRAPVRSSTPTARSSARTTASPRSPIGQRRGLGVAAGERRYVVDVDARTATVTVGAARRPAARRGRRCATCVFTDGCAVVPRRLLAQSARARRTRSRRRSTGARVRFAAPQPRVAPGPGVALYDGDVLLGGGIAT